MIWRQDLILLLPEQGWEISWQMPGWFIGLCIPLIFSGKSKRKSWGEFLMGFDAALLIEQLADRLDLRQDEASLGGLDVLRHDEHHHVARRGEAARDFGLVVVFGQVADQGFAQGVESRAVRGADPERLLPEECFGLRIGHTGNQVGLAAYHYRRNMPFFQEPEPFYFVVLRHIQLLFVILMIEAIGIKEFTAQFIGIIIYGAVNFMVNNRITFCWMKSARTPSSACMERENTGQLSEVGILGR